MLCCVVYICLAVSSLCAPRELYYLPGYYCSRGIPRQDCGIHCPIVLVDKFCGT